MAVKSNTSISDPNPAIFGLWSVTDLAWPKTPDALEACIDNQAALKRHGVHIDVGVDAFDIVDGCTRNRIDVDTVGLVLWSGPHRRRHDDKNDILEEEMKHLKWYHTSFIAAGLDMLSSSLPQASKPGRVG